MSEVPDTPPPVSPPARPRRSPLAVVWRLLLRTLAVCVIGLALLVGLFRLALPLAPNYHAQIERWAGQALDVRVILSEVDARWPLLSGPQLVFEDAALWSPDGEALLLSAERGSVELDLMQLLTSFSVSPGKVVLRGVVIDVEHRSGEGGWHVLGRAVAPSRPAPPPAAQDGASRPRGAQALPRGELEIEDATIVVTDDRSGAQAEPSRISGVHLDFAHERGSVDLEGSLQAPGDGGEVSFSVEGRGLNARARGGRWQFYLSGANVDLGAIGATVGLAPTALHGAGQVTLWASLAEGQIAQASLTLDLDDLLLAGADPHAVQYDRLAGRFDLTAQGVAAWSLLGRDLELAREGNSWPTSSFSVELDQGGLRAARADYLRLQDLLPLARLGLSLDRAERSALADELVALAPQGEFSALRYERETAQGLALSARFAGVTLAAVDDRPGVGGFGGSIDLHGKQGTLALDARELVLSYPKAFRQPLPPMAVRGSVEWAVDADGHYHVQAQDLAFEGPAFRAEGRADVHLPPAASPAEWQPEVDLEFALADMDLALVRRYVPALVMRPRVASWMEKALVKGRAPRASVAVKGPLRAFPFDGGEGEFLARAQLQDVELDYAGGFPNALGLTGVVAFDNVRMEAEGFAGSTSGNTVRTLEASIEDVREGVLVYRSRTRGTLAAVVDFLRNSPFKQHVAPLEEVGGRGEVDLDFTLPLRKREDARLHAELVADEGLVKLAGLPIPLADIAGTLSYDSQDGLAGEDIAATVVGRPVDLRLIPLYDQDGSVVTSQLEVAGRMDMGELAQHAGESVGERMDGTTEYLASLRLPLANEEVRSLAIESDLVGVQLALPAPLAKAREDALPTRFVISHSASGQASMQVDLGRVVRARVGGTLNEEALRLERGAVTFGGDAPLLADVPGLTVAGSIDLLDLSGWTAVLAGLNSGGGEAAAEGTSPLPGPERSGPEPLALPALTALDLEVAKLSAAGQVLTGLRLAMSDGGEQWTIGLQGDDLDGQIFLPKQAASGPLVARFSKLHFPRPGAAAESAEIEQPNGAPEEEAASSAEAPALDPRRLPSLVLEVDDFAWQRLAFGRVALELQAVDEGIRLPHLLVEGASDRLEGHGEWLVAADGQQESSLTLSMSSSDLLSTLERLDFAGTMSAEAASLNAAFRWQGPPRMALDGSLSGDLQVKIESGQLLNVRPGAGKIFGLMSVAALPRRLELDFRDVFDKGLGFDEISGTFMLSEGDAYTEDLQLRGQTADVRISGRTGLVARDYDQTAVVLANVGSPLPVAGALAGGPVVGAALLIFTEIMKEPLKDLSRTRYRITGPWAEPSIERVAQPAARREAAEGGDGTKAPTGVPRGR